MKVQASGGGVVSSALKRLPQLYTVYEEESQYVCESTDGLKPFTGTDIFVLIKSMWGEIPSTGGKIAFGPGTFLGGGMTLLENCDSGWASASGDVTVSHDAVDKIEGSSVKLEVADGFVSGLMAYKNLTAPVNLTAFWELMMWYKGSVGLDNDTLALVLDNHLGCVSPDATLKMCHPEDLETSWKAQKPHTGGISYWAQPVDLSALNNVQSVGLWALKDPGVITLRADYINAMNRQAYITGSKPTKFAGAGARATVLKLNTHSNQFPFYATVNGIEIEDMQIEGDLANQDVIDGVGGIYARYVDRGHFRNLYFYDLKGSGLKMRDCTKIDADVEGDTVENPTIDVSYSYEQKLRARGRNNTNDDLVRVQNSHIIDVDAEGWGSTIGNCVRVQNSDYVNVKAFAEDYVHSSSGMVLHLATVTHFHARLFGKDGNRGFVIQDACDDGELHVQLFNMLKANRVTSPSKNIKILGAIERCGYDSGEDGLYVTGEGIDAIGLTVKDADRDGLRWDGATRCKAIAGRYYDSRAAGQKTQDHGVQEVGAGDYNLVIAVDVYGNLDDTIHTVGAHTEVVHYLT